MIDVGGTQRTYTFAIPKNYDSKKFYKLVFAFHPGAEDGKFVANSLGYYGLQALSGDSTIFVAGDGLSTGFTPPGAVVCGNGMPCNGEAGAGGITGWTPQDIPFVKAMLALMRANYCIDDHRIFSVGFSMGGMMTDTIGCELGGIFRAIAPMSGSGPNTGFGGSTCMGQVAAWVAHGDMDTGVPTSAGEASRDYWVKANHCSSTTTPVDPAPCVAYQGCDPGFPVTWCKFPGGHALWAPSSKAVWDFFSQF
jgi:polyhydroxybutyrate depolymerase